MTRLPLLALAGYFLILFEYIAMRHRDICAESDRVIPLDLYWNHIDANVSMKLYWNRGTK